MQTMSDLAKSESPAPNPGAGIAGGTVLRLKAWSLAYHKRFVVIVVCVAGAALVSAAPDVRAQTPTASPQAYPARVVRIVLPFAAGGGIDLFARLLAKRMQEAFSQNVIVDNRPGAGGNIGAELVAKSAPDGYTLMLSSAAVAISATLYTKLAYDPGRDLVAVTQILSAPVVVTVHPSLPVRSIQNLVALSKKTDGGMNFGSAGVGTASHLAGVMLQQMAGARLTHVPYSGMPPAMISLLSGQVEIVFAGLNSIQQHLRSGKLRALAVTTKRKSPMLPELPTLDSVYPGFDIDNWYMLFAPVGTPNAIVTQLHAEVAKSLKHPDMTSFMQNEGAVAVGNPPIEATTFFRREIDNYAKIVKASGAKAD